MDWKLLLSTFGIIFLAEFGDKTQLAALALSGKSGTFLPVFLGAAFALITATLLGILAGTLLNKLVPERVMDVGAAILFIAVGIFLFVKALWSGEASPPPG